MPRPLLEPTDRGLYCSAGDFYIDPWKSVDRAVVTHAHSDHARPGSERYLCSLEGVGVLAARVGERSSIQGLEYGEQVVINGVSVKLYPAGHILGSAQVRVEIGGEVWVASGDYKTEADSTCTPFEPVRCHTFITESTFGLPIYQWRPQEEVYAEINQWWAKNQREGRCSFLMGYSLGKAQRALSGLDATLGPIVVHRSVLPFVRLYEREGRKLPRVLTVEECDSGFDWSKAIFVTPSAGAGTPSSSVVGSSAAAFMSGWMALRAGRRRRSADTGFVLSDHVDWPSLLSAIEATGASRVLVTHGYSVEVARYLRGRGLQAGELKTAWEGESHLESGEVEA